MYGNFLVVIFVGFDILRSGTSRGLRATVKGDSPIHGHSTVEGDEYTHNQRTLGYRLYPFLRKF